MPLAQPRNDSRVGGVPSTPTSPIFSPERAARSPRTPGGVNANVSPFIRRPAQPRPQQVPLYTPQQWLNVNISAQSPSWAGAEADMLRANAGLELARGEMQSANRHNQASFGIDQRRNNLALQNLGVDRDANARQLQHLNDLGNALARQHLLTLADIAVDEGAARRQYGLIDAARADTHREHTRTTQGLLAELARNYEREKVFKAKSRSEFRRQISEASARGNIGLIDSLGAADLRLAVEDELKEFAKQREDNRRFREAANDKFFARMRELQEQWYATDDAIKKLEIKREMEKVEQEKRRLDQEAKRREIEENNRRLFLQAASIQLAREQALLDLARQRETQLAQFFNAVANQQAAARAWSGAVQQGAAAGLQQALTTPIPTGYRPFGNLAPSFVIPGSPPRSRSRKKK